MTWGLGCVAAGDAHAHVRQRGGRRLARAPREQQLLRTCGAADSGVSAACCGGRGRLRNEWR